jgi:hypothetical protein
LFWSFSVRDKVKRTLFKFGEELVRSEVKQFYQTPKPSFSQLVKKPERQEPKRKLNPANKPPSLELTCGESLIYLREKDEAVKNKNSKGKGKGKSSTNVKVKASTSAGTSSDSRYTSVSTEASTSSESEVEPKKKKARVGTSKAKMTACRVTRSSNPHPTKMSIDKSVVCPSCNYYKGDPQDDVNDSDEDWIKCIKCNIEYHEFCARAVKRCKCGKLFAK